jgi:hypothetical protein
MRRPFTEPMFGETPYKTTPVHLIHLFTKRRLAPQNAVRARATAMANGVWRRQTQFGARARARADTHTHTHTHGAPTATATANGIWRRQTPFGETARARADTHTHTNARRADGDSDG